MRIDENTCPYCQSHNIEYDAIEISDDGIYYPCRCKDCGGDFEEHYNTIFAGITFDGEFHEV